MNRNHKGKACRIEHSIGGEKAFEARFRGRMDLGDRVQAGLKRASETHDPNWGTKSSTYAAWWIRQAIYREFDNAADTIRVPVHMRAQIAKFRRTRWSLGLSQEYRPSDIFRIAETLGWNEARASLVAQLSKQSAVSLDAPRADDADLAVGSTIKDDAPSPEDIAIANDLVEAAGNLVNDLENDRLRDIVRRRFGMDGPAQTLEEIGEVYGVTRGRIRQLEKKALFALRKRARKFGLHESIEEN